MYFRGTYNRQENNEFCKYLIFSLQTKNTSCLLVKLRHHINYETELD